MTTWKKEVNGVKSPNASVRLSALRSVAVALAEQSDLSGFPLGDLCKSFVKILQNEKDRDILEACTQCILNSLMCYDAAAARGLMSIGFLPAVSSRLDDLPPESAQNLVHALSVMTKSYPADVGQVIGIERILNLVPCFRAAEQRFAVQAISRITTRYVDKESARCLGTLVSLTRNSDLAVEAMAAFRNIMRGLDMTDVPVCVVEELVESTRKVSDAPILLEVLGSLLDFAQLQVLAEAIVAAKVNFKALLENEQFNNEALMAVKMTLELMKLLLPPADLPGDFWPDSPTRCAPTNVEILAESAAPTLVEILFENCHFMELVLCNLAMCCKVKPMPLEVGLVGVLTGVSQKPGLAPFVVLLCESCSNREELGSSDLVTCLANVKQPPGTAICSWYEERVKKLQEAVGSVQAKETLPMPEIFMDFPTLVDFVNRTDFSVVDFYNAGYCEVALELINKCRNFQCVKMDKLCDVLLQVINYSPIPDLIDPCQSFSSIDFAKQTLTVDIRCDGRIFHNKVFESEAMLVSIEAWYNEKVNRVKPGLLRRAAQRAGRLGQIIAMDFKGDTYSYAKLGICHRIFKTHNYQRFSFKIDNKTFGYLDSLYEAVARNLPSPDYWGKIIPTIELIPETERLTTSSIDVPKTALPRVPVFDLLAKMVAIQPDLKVQCPSYEKILTPFLSSFFLDIGLYSPAVQAAANYPFLFSCDFRTLIFRLISVDFFSALTLAHRVIFRSPEKLREGRIFCHVHVNRESLFADGCLLLTSIGVGPIQLDLQFEGEAGFGIGPTREFFTEFSKELCKKERNLWRTDVTESEYAFSENGLFPSPTADPEMFSILGILCAKAVSASITLPLPLNKEFFKLIKGEPVSIDAVDPALARTLSGNKQDLFGLPFVYPGYGEIELLPGGAEMQVNRENVHKFVALVKEFTCNSDRLKNIAQRFIDGLSSVFQRGCWNILNADEFHRMIVGDNVAITMEDLTKYVDVCHGYGPGSPQIKMLFEIISEMSSEEQSLFLKFATASDKLPIGGLANLHPPLTIARRVDDEAEVDDALPSAATCSNFFKLPPYSTKEIMKQKLFTAITEGQGVFLFT